MKFLQHHSSSSGNLYEVVANNGKRLLIDPGVPWIKVQRALEFKLEGIEGCLCSHGHQDHCKSLADVRRAGINIYGSETTMKAARVVGRRINVVRHQTLIRLGSFEVLCFTVVHDCEGSLGFVVREIATGEYLLFAIDTKVIKQRFTFPFSIIAIECSYNGEYLAEKVDAGEINETLAKRLIESHMEQSECLRYLIEFCNLQRCREIHLLHLSASNIYKEKLIERFKDMLLLEVVTV